MLNVPFTKLSIFHDGSFTIPGAMYMLAASGVLWWIILYLIYPPAIVLIYLAWAASYGSLALTGGLWLIMKKVVPAVRSYWKH